MKKILHITNWYPNPWNDLEAIFIKKQFDIFSKVTDSELINIQVRDGKKIFEFKYIRYSEKEEGYYILTKIKSNKIIEFLTTFLLLYVLCRKNYKKYDILHFHIAYPLLIHYFLWKKIIKKPIMISEHWSAYYFNFYMPKNTKKLDGIKRIFKQNIPLITVSKALLEDIEKFSGLKQDRYTIIPNIISVKYINKKRQQPNYPILFMLNNWRKIKNPFPILRAIKKLKDNNIEFKLNIGGYGELLEEMKKFVKNNQLENRVIFLGKLYNKEIEKELNNSDAFLFSSIYETFSVVCAEAYSCGCVLIGSDLKAVREYANNDLIEVKLNNEENWYQVLKKYIYNFQQFNKNKIANKSKNLFDNTKITSRYLKFLKELE